MSQFLQCIFSGLTVGAIYAVVAIGFTVIYAASDVVNFAQGEFVMIGGMVTCSLSGMGMPVLLAGVIAVLVAMVFGLLLQKLAIEHVAESSPVTLIIITLGASTFIRGIAGLVFDKQFHGLPSFSGDNPILVLGAAILPQSFWVLGSALVLFLLLWLFLEKTVKGKALRACAANRLAAKLIGVNISFMLCLAFALSAAFGAIAGIFVTPITMTRYDVGALLALKGFSAAIFGGLGNPLGAVVGGLMLGFMEALAAGYLTSVYKDGVAFVALILILLVMPDGLLGAKVTDRV
jgi:branched-chain amino acid transport system permease protein